MMKTSRLRNRYLDEGLKRLRLRNRYLHEKPRLRNSYLHEKTRLRNSYLHEHTRLRNAHIVLRAARAQPSATVLGSPSLSHGPWLAALGSQPRPPARAQRTVLYCRPTHVVLLHDRCMWYYIAEAVGSTVISAIPLLPRLDEHLSGILQERILIDLFASQRRRRH